MVTRNGSGTMTETPKGAEAIKKFGDTVIGLAAIGARSLGWSEAEARRIGLEAGRSAQGRIAEGASAEAALEAGIADGQLVAVLDRFSRHLTRDGDAHAAFAAATAPIREAPEADGRVAAAAAKAAEDAFAAGLAEGQAPAAALASANGAATTAARLVRASD